MPGTSQPLTASPAEAVSGKKRKGWTVKLAYVVFDPEGASHRVEDAAALQALIRELRQKFGPHAEISGFAVKADEAQPAARAAS